VSCIAFNLTGVSGFTYKGHKPIRKQVTILFKVDSTPETKENRIYDFGVDGLDMFYYSDPMDMPGATFQLRNTQYNNTFNGLTDGTGGPEFVVTPSVFKTAYEDTNILGISLITQMALSRIETITQDSPDATVSYAIGAVSAQLNEDQVISKFGPLAKGVNESHIGLIMVFNGPEITLYSFLPPSAGALLGQLGGLKGLLIDFWILAIVVVLCAFILSFAVHGARAAAAALTTRNTRAGTLTRCSTRKASTTSTRARASWPTAPSLWPSKSKTSERCVRARARGVKTDFTTTLYEYGYSKNPVTRYRWCCRQGRRTLMVPPPPKCRTTSLSLKAATSGSAHAQAITLDFLEGCAASSRSTTT